MSDTTLLALILLVCLATLAAVSASLVLKVRYGRFLAASLQRTNDTLALVKGWSEIAHSQHKDARRVMDRVEAKSAADAPVLAAVAAIPDATAEKVVEKIQGQAGEWG